MKKLIMFVILLCFLPAVSFVYDTTGLPIYIIRESEFGIYETTTVKARTIIKQNINNTYILTIDDVEYFLTSPKERWVKKK